MVFVFFCVYVMIGVGQFMDNVFWQQFVQLGEGVDVGGEVDVDFVDGEVGVVVGVVQVVGVDQVDVVVDVVVVECGDYWYVVVFQGVEGLLYECGVVVEVCCFLYSGGDVGWVWLGVEYVQVEFGGEVFVVGVDDDGVNVVVGVQGLYCCWQFVLEVCVYGVEFVGLVQGDFGDMVVNGDGECFVGYDGFFLFQLQL